MQLYKKPTNNDTNNLKLGGHRLARDATYSRLPGNRYLLDLKLNEEYLKSNFKTKYSKDLLRTRYN